MIDVEFIKGLCAISSHDQKSLTLASLGQLFVKGTNFSSKNKGREAFNFLNCRVLFFGVEIGWLRHFKILPRAGGPVRAASHGARHGGRRGWRRGDHLERSPSPMFLIDKKASKKASEDTFQCTHQIEDAFAQNLPHREGTRCGSGEQKQRRRKELHGINQSIDV